MHHARVAASDHLKALERAAGHCSDTLRGLCPEPDGEAWAAAAAQHKRLLEQRVAVPSELLEQLDAAMAVCQVSATASIML